jgi:hypothetical protein
MKPVLVVLLIAASLSAAAQGQQSFTGIIADDMCADGTHSHMKMGPTDGECARACVALHGAAYVLWDGKQAYVLSDQKTPESFAAKKVRVTGTLDPKTRTIQVSSMVAAD